MLAEALVIGAGILAGGWAILFRQVSVQVAGTARDVPVEVFGLGMVKARITSQVGFKISDLRADVGERVSKNAVLARLDDREQGAQVARATAAVTHDEMILDRFDHIFRLRDGRLERGTGASSA